MSESSMAFKQSDALTLGVELELQLLTQRDYDLTRGATDVLSRLSYDGTFGDVKLEITESMIEVSTQARATVDAIASDLEGLRKMLIDQCARNNIAICGGATHPFHAWPERRICPSERFDAVYQRYGYLAKQFTVFGQHVHVGCETADDAIWLTQALGPYVPIFIALSASSPFVDGVDTFFQSARLNAVSAFPLSGQCPEVADWAAFVEHFQFLKACGIVSSIKDLYWDIRPKPEFGTVEIRVCDTPLSIETASALAALAQCTARYLLRTRQERPPINTRLQLYVARYNKFQACRYGFDAMLSNPIAQKQEPLRVILHELLAALVEDAEALGCVHWLERIKLSLAMEASDARWLREHHGRHENLHDVVRESVRRFAGQA